MEKKLLKKGAIPLLAGIIGLSLLFASCSPKDKESKGSGEKKIITVNVASRYDSVKIWEALNKILEPDNIKVVNKAYDASVNLNDLLIAGDVDLNVAQHYAAIEYFKASSDKYADLVALGDIHISTIDLYSNKYDSVDALPAGATIAIPNDVMNGGRALTVLDKEGIIKLNDDYKGFPDEKNIVENPKNLKFKKVDSSSMIRVLDDVDAGFAYSLNAVDAGLNPAVDPILKDTLDLKNNPTQKQFIIVFTGVKGDENNEVYKKIIQAYHSEEIYKVYKEVFKGGNIPVDNGEPVDLSKY